MKLNIHKLYYFVYIREIFVIKQKIFLVFSQFSIYVSKKWQKFQEVKKLDINQHKIKGIKVTLMHHVIKQIIMF